MASQQNPHHDKPFDIVNLQGEDVLAIETVILDDFTKAYLGDKGRNIAHRLIREGRWRLDDGWENARFAAVNHGDDKQPLGLVAEYPDGTLAALELRNGKTSDTDADALVRYLRAEALQPPQSAQRGWEEVEPGAVIREKFTSTGTYTGTWAKSVAVIDPDKCNVCRQCAIWCPEDGIDLDPVSGKLSFVDYDYCKGCGICQYVCPPEQGAIEMVDQKDVAGAQAKVFDGIYGKRIEVFGDAVAREVDWIVGLAEKPGYDLVYDDRSGKKSLSGRRALQITHTPDNLATVQRPLLHTFSSENGKQWTQIVRPLANILVYGMSEQDQALASRLQLEGFQVTAIPSRATNGGSQNGEGNERRESFEKAGLALDKTLETAIDGNGRSFDAVVTAHYDMIDGDQQKMIAEKIGTLRAPYMPNRTRDDHFENIIQEIQSSVPEPVAPEDDRPLARVQEREGDIASGHRLCAGCPVGTAFNLVVRAVGDLDPDIENIHSGATSCAEVATTIYPDTAWPSYLHTTFGGLGANLEGLNAAYRYLQKRGRINKKLKFWGWAGDGGTYDIGLQALSGFLERGLAKDAVYFCYDNGAYMNTGIQRSSATPLGAQTSTSPIGEEIPGKPQFRKDLEHIAGAHNDVYVAKVSPSHQIDFINKMKKAVQHDGPALIICYSNCTTGHRTDMELTTEQSRLAVECGFWPLLEIENGETRLAEPIPSAYDPRIKPENRVTLMQWMGSEGRFAQHFDKKGNFVSREHEMQFRELERQLLIAWRKVQAEDKLTKKKDKLMAELTECLREKDAKRLKDLATKPHLFGLAGYTQTYIDDLSWIEDGGKPKPFLQRVLQNVRRTLDPDAYKLKDPGLRDTLYSMFIKEYKTLIEDQRGIKREHAQKAAIAREGQKIVESTNAPAMDAAGQQRNRALVGAPPLAGRIFARAGDGGVTAAKLFVSLLKEVGLYGKAAPDYGPERRGAPVGTNFTMSGKELRTQASFQDLVTSIVVNADDPGWPIRQWRDAVVEGGSVIINTPHSASAARQTYGIPRDRHVVTIDASAVRQAKRVPETVTLMAGVLKALSARGLDFAEEHLAGRWKKLLAKEFADKANAEKIVQSNMDAFWDSYHSASVSPAAGPSNGHAADIAGFEQSPPEKLMTGSEAVAEAWRQINPGVFAMFPITPSTEVGQTFSQFWADGKVDTEFIHTESEHSSFMTIIAAAVAGVRAVTSTASQGMLLGKEGGLLAASLRLPVVVNVGARETNAPLNIHAGHTDFYQFRDDGWIHFMARNAQEAYDFAVIAQKASETAGLPAFINQDGFIVTHNKDMLDTLSDDEVQAFVGEYDPEHSLLKTGGTFNPVALQDYYSEHVRTLAEAQKAAPAIVDQVFEEFAQLTGRRYSRVNDYKTEGADVVVVALGSTEGTAMDAVDELRADGLQVGLLALKTFRPFPAAEIRKALADTKAVIVMDRANSHGAELTPLATEVQAALGRPVLNLEYGRGGRNTPLDLVKDVYRLGSIVASDVDSAAARRSLSEPDAELRALLNDLESLEGSEFTEAFAEQLIAGRLIEAFGPWEHIDVRETHKRRQIKLRIIEKVVA